MTIGIVSDRRRLARAAAVSDAEAANLLVEQAAAAAAAGADFYQLREPDLDAYAMVVLARRLVDVIGDRLSLYVNERADVAVLAGAGVHLRASSLPAERLRAWLPAATVMTRAVHRPDDARSAGPVEALIAGTAAPTPSKAAGHPTLGADGLRAIVEASTVPVIAIGGLTSTDWPWLAAAGACGLAGIGLFLPTPGERVHEAVERAVLTCRTEAATLASGSDERAVTRVH